MADERIRVAVLMGGRSGEHDVSRASGWAVLTQLPAARFDALPVVLGRDGAWHFPTPEAADPERGDLAGPGHALPEGLRQLLDREPAVAFIAMHGPEGEDGRLQSLFELVGLPFTGSGADASSLAMNKPVAKAVYRAHGIPVAGDLEVARADWEADPSAVLARIRAAFAPPWVLKTPRLGSSVGLDIVPADGDLESTVGRLIALDQTLMVEAFVAGRELTCGVLDAPAFGPLRALPVLEITPVESGFFDYHAKYTPGAAREVCPAPIPDDLRDQVQELGLRSHRALGCRGFSRTDFIYGEQGLVTLETNTIPGLTRTSLLPQQAAADGLSFADLAAGMVLGALGRER